MVFQKVLHFNTLVLLIFLTGCKLASDGTNDEQTNGELQKNAIEKIGADMIFVKAGEFKDGCPDASEPHQNIAVHNFYISRFEVSQEEWLAIMDTNPSFTKCPTCPVNNISFNSAQRFISKLNALTGKQYRLPTDAEWKYMKRGGRPGLAYKYSGNILAKFDSTQPNVHYVNQLDTNELGIYDLDSSDVWEFYNAATPNGNIQVMRSAYSLRQDAGERWCVISYRSLVTPKRKEYSLGLRLARD